MSEKWEVMSCRFSIQEALLRKYTGSFSWYWLLFQGNDIQIVPEPERLLFCNFNRWDVTSSLSCYDLHWFPQSHMTWNLPPSVAIEENQYLTFNPWGITCKQGRGKSCRDHSLAQSLSVDSERNANSWLLHVNKGINRAVLSGYLAAGHTVCERVNVSPSHTSVVIDLHQIWKWFTFYLHYCHSYKKLWPQQCPGLSTW